MLNIISRIKHYFIADEGEEVSASDYAIFYGVMLGLPAYAAAIIFIA